MKLGQLYEIEYQISVDFFLIFELLKFDNFAMKFVSKIYLKKYLRA